MSYVRELKPATPFELERGANKFVTIDVSQLNMKDGEYVMFTMRDLSGNLIKEIKITNPNISQLLFTQEFTATLNDAQYEYDLMFFDRSGQRTAECAPTGIHVYRTDGGYRE